MDEIINSNEKHTLLTMGEIMNIVNEDISSGISELNLLTGGFTAPELVVLASRPGLGKSTLAITMLRNIAIEKNIPAGFFSLEIDGYHLIQRLLAQEAMIPVSLLRKGRISESDFIKLVGITKKLSNAPAYFIDIAQISIKKIYHWIKHMILEKAVKVVFIDYLGLIKSETILSKRLERKIEILSELKNMTRELGITIIALEQIGRNFKGIELQRQLERTTEQADMVLHLESALEKSMVESYEAKLHIIKHHDKQPKTIDLLFHRKIPTFIW